MCIRDRYIQVCPAVPRAKGHLAVSAGASGGIATCGDGGEFAFSVLWFVEVGGKRDAVTIAEGYFTDVYKRQR